ncbi:MAG: hypothetical protein DRJ61_10185 [Acidobacteria bacterium]|nr:MAG: hypothetical protein DRJ61_10185 [Acidobacteriota bacterium]
MPAMILVFSILLGLSVVVLAILWWIQQRQRRQIRQLLTRLEAVEAETEIFVRGPGSDESVLPIAAEESSGGTLSDDVLAGYTSYVQRVISEPGEAPTSLSGQVIMKIYQHLEDGYRPTQLADDLFISLRTLERGLTEVFDCSPSQLITAMKMREARRMLETGEYRVNEVASRLGFSSPFYFSRRFRTFFGVSPSEYRQVAESGG